MSEAQFPPNVAAALDRLTVPPLPDGFADRLLARLAAGDMPLESANPPQLPERRRPRILGGRWRRSGFVVGSIGILGMATATAAASGIFGEPIYLPVVSEVLAKTNLVENPKDKPRHATVKTPKVEPAVAASPAKTETQPSSGQQAVQDRLQTLRADPAYRALPLREKLLIARREIGQMVKSGQASQADVDAVWADMLKSMPPKRREKLEALQERREQRRAGAKEGAAQFPRAGAKPTKSPQAKAERREAIRQMPENDRARIAELRAKLPGATPAERRVIRKELREIWSRNAGATAGQMDQPET